MRAIPSLFPWGFWCWVVENTVPHPLSWGMVSTLRVWTVHGHSISWPREA